MSETEIDPADLALFLFVDYLDAHGIAIGQMIAIAIERIPELAAALREDRAQTHNAPNALQ